MIEPSSCELIFVPTGLPCAAQIISLSPELIADKVSSAWWMHPDLVDNPDPPPIDRDWDWNDLEIDCDDLVLPSELVGVMTGDGYVHGAMLISSVGIRSRLNARTKALFVERLFTAPVNRSYLRTDQKKYFAGVGPMLLKWAVQFSKMKGCHGRLRLDGSPDYIAWYENLGFTKLNIEPIVFEGVQYLPMELSAAKAQALLDRYSADVKGKKQ